MVNMVASTEGVRVRSEFPRMVKTIDHLWIPVDDNVRLSARVWIPEDAESHPVPAIIEYIPYRHRDATLPRDELLHPWFAGHGYAAIRIDLRGSGNSEGAPLDEYVLREQEDMLAALAWIASQPWCTGSCGMIGISWGGFAALQAAFRRPTQLKAIVAVCATHDRFAEDVHYKSGCVLRNNLTWSAHSQTYTARPPDPVIVGDAWRDMWRQRIEEMPFLLGEWLSRQQRDDYWKHGSVCEDWDAIACPVYATTGWADGYTNSVLHMAEHLSVPRRCVIGPWAHAYPHLGVPGPATGFLQDCLRWWDRWLKGIENGIENDPPVYLWLQDALPPAVQRAHQSGRWITEDNWPSKRTACQLLYPTATNGLDAAPGKGEISVATDLSVGLMAGEWNPHGFGPELAGDQRIDDARSVLFHASSADHDRAVVGQPVIGLRLKSDKPLAQIVARLVMVAPDGQSSLISLGCLNLAHRRSSEHPQPLEEGVFEDVSIVMNAVAQTVPAGHGLRLALSTGSWPLLWPAPELATLTVDCAASRLHLPIHVIDASSDDEATFDPPEIPCATDITWERPPSRKRKFVTDVANSSTELVLEKDDGFYRIESHGMAVDQIGFERQFITYDDPLSSKGEVSWVLMFERGDWKVAIDSETTLCCDAENFYASCTIVATEGERVFAQRKFERKIPREFV